MLVSVCMIVKNEEETLPHALTSVQGLADEIVILDTGSEDRTLEIARAHNALVMTGGDAMHKAASRNRALDAASGDWVVVLDADERIADPCGLRAFLEGTKADAVYVRLAYMDTNDQPTLEYSQMRCWRRGAYQYKYRAHEVPVPMGDWGQVVHTDFVWEHRPPAGRTWKTSYTLKRLLLDVEENPGDGRPLYYLGRQYIYAKEWGKALGCLQRYLELAPDGRDVADAHRLIAVCHAAAGDQEAQIVSLYHALAIQPERRDWYGELAEIYHARGQEPPAIALLRCALELPPPAGSYTYRKWYGPHIYDLLARCLWKLRRYAEGETYARQARDLAPGDVRLHRNWLFFADAAEAAAHSPGHNPTVPAHSPEVLRGLRQGTDPAHGKLKVLLLAHTDFAGVAWRTANALNLAGHAARYVTRVPQYTRFPHDIFNPSDQELAEWLGWADVVHFFDDWPREGLDALGKPLFVTYNGTIYRDNWQHWNEEDARYGIVQLCTTIDLQQYGPRWMPVPVAPNGTAPRRNGRFTVVHCPTRRDRKGTGRVQRLSELEELRVDVVEGVSHEECLLRKAAANVLVDQFELGYGVNALEAWALGLPVVSDARPEILNLIEAEVGALPFMRPLPSLADAVQRLRDDDRECQEWAGCGAAYLRKFHDPATIARQLIAIYADPVANGCWPGREGGSRA